jgi:hypothetical protein
VTVTRVIDARLAGLVVAAIGAVTALAAGIVWITLAPRVRDWLDLGFGGVPPRGSEAVSIFLANARLAGAPLAVAAIAQIPLLIGDERLAQLLRGVERACAALLLLFVAFNLAVVGAAVGAYGWRVLRTVLVHGPFELAAYSLVLSVWLRARRELVPVRGWLAAIAVTAGLLAAGAVLETFTSL